MQPSEWTNKTIHERIESGIRKWVKLPQKVPVYIVYYTTWSDDDGMVYFYDDVYGRNNWTPEQVSCNYGSVNNTCNPSTTAEQE